LQGARGEGEVIAVHDVLLTESWGWPVAPGWMEKV
jgi:hypothetical protein